MNINDRIKFLRNTICLSQEAFGKSILLERSTISLIERHQRNVTNRIFNDICREFNVNESWLRYGVGEMFIENDGLLEKCLKENNATESDIKLIKCYLNLDLDIRNKIHKHFEGYFNNI